jgi:hypothetical protein
MKKLGIGIRVLLQGFSTQEFAESTEKRGILTVHGAHPVENTAD